MYDTFFAFYCISLCITKTHYGKKINKSATPFKKNVISSFFPPFSTTKFSASFFLILYIGPQSRKNLQSNIGAWLTKRRYVTHVSHVTHRFIWENEKRIPNVLLTIIGEFLVVKQVKSYITTLQKHFTPNYYFFNRVVTVDPI